jgi:hypothetical protein
MGIDCLSECPECNRHVRCGERACPFCGAKVASFMRVLEYRIVNRLDRSRVFSLGAALTAAGFLTNCETESVAVYGAPCNPPACGPNAGTAGQAGEPSSGGGSDVGSGGVPSTAGAPPTGEGGEPSEGGSSAGGAPTSISAGAGGQATLGGAGGAGGGD